VREEARVEVGVDHASAQGWSHGREDPAPLAPTPAGAAGEYDPHVLESYFKTRPVLVANRLLEVLAAGTRALASTAMFRSDRSKQYAAYREIVERLGPAFMKIAQTLSTRPDLIGEDLASELGSFQDRARPFSNRLAFEIMEEELGRPIQEVFQDIDENPVAAASLGQVYRAQLFPSSGHSSGKAVAVKVQRPGALEKIAVDIYILRGVLQAVKIMTGMTRDLRLIADEVGSGLYGELDYRIEAENAQAFAAAHQGLGYLVVPEPLPGLTTERVLTMEWVDGSSPANLFLDFVDDEEGAAKNPAAAEAELKLKKLVNMGVACSLNQLLKTGVMHADPHPGNLIYTDGGKLAYVDFGLLTRVEPRHRQGMLSSILHMSNGDWRGFVDDLDQLELLKPTVRKEDLERDFDEMMGKSTFKNFSKLLKVMAKLGVKYKFTLPPFYVLVVRSLATLEGIALQVDSEFKIVSAAVPQALVVLSESEALPTELFQSYLTGEMISKVLDVFEERREPRTNRKLFGLFRRVSRALLTKPAALLRFWCIALKTVVRRLLTNVAP